MKSLFVKNLEEHKGKEIESEFLVAKKEFKRKKDGSPYIELVLSDVTGTVQAVIFEKVEKHEPLIRIGKVLRVRGIVGTYNEELQIKVSEIQDVLAFDPQDYVPSTDKDVNILMKELTGLIGKVLQPHLKRLLEAFFIEDRDFVEKFKRAPAAVRHHHPYLGGLLEHTLSVAELSLTIAKNYREVNEDVLLTGALLHDVGKVEEYTTFPRIERTDRGRLLGHVVIGYEMVSNKILKIKDYLGGFPEDLALQVLHIVLSHHGELSWGSPVVPHTLEAQIVHFVDNLDAKAWMFIEAKEMRKDPLARWSEYHRGLARMVYLGSTEENEEE